MQNFLENVDTASETFAVLLPARACWSEPIFLMISAP